MPSSSTLRPIVVASLLTLAGLVALPAVGRESARNAERTPPARNAEPETPGAWTAGKAPAADCTRARRKLWQAEQGWIVKTITTCH